MPEPRTLSVVFLCHLGIALHFILTHRIQSHHMYVLHFLRGRHVPSHLEYSLDSCLIYTILL